LEKDSVSLGHQITTLDRTKLTKRLGTLSDLHLSEVGEGLKIARDLT